MLLHMALLEEVLAELRAARRTPDGLNQASMGGFPTLCGVLGQGDPIAAFASLHTAAKTHEMDQYLAAALQSLGLGSARGPVWKRLQTFSQEARADERTVRRWADEGLPRLARLIVTNWRVSVPFLRLSVRQPQSDVLLVAIATERPNQVQMDSVRAVISHDGGPAENLDLGFVIAPGVARDGWHLEVASNGLLLDLRKGRSVLLVHWVGELWPEMDVQVKCLEPLRFHALGGRFTMAVGYERTAAAEPGNSGPASPARPPGL